MRTDLMMIAKSTPYPLEAFIFVQRGLDFTVKKLHGDAKESPDTADRHVSGAQLCHGLRDFAIHQYGLLARTVLNRWNIHRTECFGEIVFAMVDAGLLRKTDHDTLEDFDGVLDFDQAFGRQLHLSENA